MCLSQFRDTHTNFSQVITNGVSKEKLFLVSFSVKLAHAFVRDRSLHRNLGEEIHHSPIHSVTTLEKVQVELVTPCLGLLTCRLGLLPSDVEHADRNDRSEQRAQDLQPER